MKYRIILGALLLAFACTEIYAIDYKNNEDSITEQLFLKSERIAIRNRAKIMKIRFLDPIGNNELFYKIIKKETPDLINNTNTYKLGLLKLLKDKTIRKDWYTDSDIINLLCDLCIDNYVDVIDSVRTFVVRGQLNFKILNNVIFQDFNLTNQVARNYKNPKLHELLMEIKNDIQLGKIMIPKNNYGFMEELNKLISGEKWENDLKKDEIKHPPLLNSKDCR